MKFKILVRSGTDEWWEEYDKTCDDARAEAEQIVARFNDSLQPQEKRHAILDVVVLDERDSTTPHVWKKTNTFTQSYAGRRFDTYKCQICGITGKRFGLEEIIHRDHTFKAKVYSDCAKAKAHLAEQRRKSVC